MQRYIPAGVAAVLILAVVSTYVLPPIHVGYRGEDAVGAYHAGAVIYGSDPIGNVMVYDRIGGPLFLLQLLVNGAPWLTKCPSDNCGNT